MKTIAVNEVGFKSEDSKKAVLNFEPSKLYIVGEKDKREIKASHYGKDDCSGEDTWVADFSFVKEVGKYHIEADGEKSAEFEISDKPYDSLMNDLLKCYYYLRCGCGLDEKFAGVYKHGKCHTKLAKVYGDESTLVDVTGGWHDAGDYGRYTTAGAVAVAHLLYGVKFNPLLLDVELNIPKEKGMPDILAEIKVELDFLMKMQREDGSCWHKVTTMRHADFIMPEEDINDLYLFPVSSIATGDFAAVCALASGVYKKYDSDYSKKLLEAALNAYEWLEENPGELLFKNPPESNTGEYGETEDISNRFWAAAAFYELTHDDKYRREAIFQKKRLKLYEEANAKFDINTMTGLGWADVGGLGAFSLILSGDEELSKECKEIFKKEADRICDTVDKNGYGVPMTSDDFIWGSNMVLGEYLMIMAVVNRYYPNKKYVDTLKAGFDYLLGCNPMNVSYVTGNGDNAFKNPHLRPTAMDGIELPWKGLVSGGPNKGLQDEKAQEVPKNTAPMKCYLDEVDCYSLNEITIYWNSPFIFALAEIL